MLSCFENKPDFVGEIRKINGVSVTVSYPAHGIPSGVTFLLPGAMINVKEYASTRDVLLSRGQIVLSMYINVMVPFRENHRKHAQRIKSIFDAFREDHRPDVPPFYNIVGHSVGGKIALLVASLYDSERVNVIIALDPVDENPSEFTAGGRTGEVVALKIPLTKSSSPAILTLTDGGRGISKEHNAKALHDANPTTTDLVRHEGAGHMAYTDNGGGMVGLLMPGKDEAADKAARERAHDLIRAHIGASTVASDDDNDGLDIVCVSVPLIV